MRASNETIQRYYFDLFSKDYPLPAGAVEHGDKPDVIVYGNRKIGIEMTNFYLEDGDSPSSEQVQSRLREQAVADAQCLYERKTGRGVHLTLGFDTPIQNKSRLAKQLADFATRLEGCKTGNVRSELFGDIPELSFAWLLENTHEDAWRIVQVYSTPIMSLEKLREIIREKERKSAEYKLCDAYWLLVIVNFIDRAQDQEIRVDGFDTISSKIFEKIIVYKTCFGQILETCETGGRNK